jgi:hypothetical protein
MNWKRRTNKRISGKQYDTDDPNMWYTAAMDNVETVVRSGGEAGRPRISELIDLAMLEQIHRIGNILERRFNELEE